MEWISVKDRLPEDDQTILFINAEFSEMPIIGWYEKDSWFIPNASMFPIAAIATHWMPLPKSPAIRFKVVAEMQITKEFLDRGPQPPKLPGSM